MPAEGWRRRGVPRGHLARLALLASALGVATGAATGEEPPADLLAACAACHGHGGNSPTPEMPSIASQPRVFIENQLVLIREGLREVPAMKAVMGGLDDAAIVALSRHYGAQPASPLPMTVQREQRLRGAELSRQALCGTCHLADYTGQNQVPRLAGQNEAYLRLSMQQFRDDPGPGRDTIMAATLIGMTDADLAALAHYLASTRP